MSVGTQKKRFGALKKVQVIFVIIIMLTKTTVTT